MVGQRALNPFIFVRIEAPEQKILGSQPEADPPLAENPSLAT